jgi:hypothetical protein
LVAAKDIFHFPRLEEARRFLDRLQDGEAQALVMFGQRRTGKTRFLVRDLAPLAEQRGIRAVYSSFWTSDPPLEVLTNDIELRLRAKTPRALVDLRNRLETSFTMRSPELPGAPSGAMTFTAKPMAASQRSLIALDNLFDRICGARSTVLFMFDEVQQLATSPAHAPFIAQLRTSLDKRQRRALAVFTGSSESGLHAMFARRDAPMFNLGNRVSLKPLGAEFIAHQQSALLKRNIRVPAAKLAAALAALQGRAAEFEIFRNRLIDREDGDAEAALSETLNHIAEFHGYPREWRPLGGLHRAILRVLASGIEKPYSEDALARIGRLRSGAAPSAQTVQGALRTLVRRGLLLRFEPRGGPYQLADPGFADWVLKRPNAEFASRIRLD